ncbi:hypothetical protein BC937DRAFT_86772 [Endogone sp. FLAS-F59071]|nr:hypothetical protein BC937DRAFT_86772 [Endogone sp. FLAS-F59071]|eukprot:RUS19888.1 hypothetical protein BC937DRAFT_86772 [Endogone sp. FLAS-F59071]
MSTSRPTTTTPQQTVLQISPTTHLQRGDIEQCELRQTAGITLQQYSVLAMHSIATGESPAQTRLRMMRYA